MQQLCSLGDKRIFDLIITIVFLEASDCLFLKFCVELLDMLILFMQSLIDVNSGV
jgi:hypothetical protein